MIYITGDTHGDPLRFSSSNFKEGKDLNKKDCVIICGDFGLIWKEHDKESEYWLEWLNNKPWTTLFIEGNHSNFDLLNKYSVEQWNGGKIHRIKENIIHLTRGQIFNIDGKNVFTMGGAQSIDKMYRIEGISWWKEEMPSYREMNEGIDNLLAFDKKIDIILTHTCPLSVLDYVVESDKIVTGLEKYLDEVRTIVESKSKDYKWYFGHFHQHKKIDDNFMCLYKDIIKI